MGIVQDDVAKVRAATDVVALVGEQVALRRVGTRLVGLCPFHTEKTPSFSVNPAEGFYYCFGCGASGDVITFARDTQQLDFVGAVEWLAARAGITVRYDEARVNREHQKRSGLVDVMTKAVDWYHQRLLSGADSGAARRYLRDRGYDGETVRQFRLGWAPDEWDALARALGVTRDVLVDTGLGFVNKAGKQQDSFRARVMFPIFDVAGHPVAFGGRVLPGGEGSKYKNSQETPIYSKRRTLYGLNWAKADVVRAGEVIVCEGYTDVIGFFRAGVPRAVATCGTALAEEHMRALKNFARRIVLAYDADAAGQGAAEKFYAWEKTFELDIAVVTLPSGSDPAELAGRDPEALRQAVTEARPYLAFRLERVLEAADLRSPEGRARAANAALTVIAEHPDNFVRDQYLMEVENRCRVDAGDLRVRLEELLAAGPARPGGSSGGTRARRVRAAETDEPPPPEPPWGDEPPHDDRDEGPAGGQEGSGTRGRERSTAPEAAALRLAIQRPELVADQLESVLFAHPLYRAAFDALAAAETLHDAVDTADPEVADLVRRLAVEEDDSDPVDVVALLVRHAAWANLRRLEAEVRATQQPISTTPHRLLIEQLDDPLTRVDAIEQLVRWLVRSAEEGT